MIKPTYEKYCRNEQETSRDLEVFKPFAEAKRFKNPELGEFLEHIALYINAQAIINMLRHIEDRLDEIEKRLINR